MKLKYKIRTLISRLFRIDLPFLYFATYRVSAKLEALTLVFKEPVLFNTAFSEGDKEYYVLFNRRIWKVTTASLKTLKMSDYIGDGTESYLKYWSAISNLDYIASAKFIREEPHISKKWILADFGDRQWTFYLNPLPELKYGYFKTAIIRMSLELQYRSLRKAGKIQASPAYVAIPVTKDGDFGYLKNKR